MKREQIVWVDMLRVFACFLVVLAHCCDHFVGKFDDNYSEFFAGALWGSFYRPCVPLFAMLTGVLILPIRQDISIFYRTKISRIVYPMIFWSIVTPFLYYLYINSGVENLSIAIDPDGHTLKMSIYKVFSAILNFSYDTIPFWYLYMLIGIYLVAPIVSTWLKNSSQSEIKLVLKIWLFTTIIPYIQLFAPSLGYLGNYGNMGILGVCDWNIYGTFYYMSGFMGYLILAHYLIRFPLEWSWRKCITICSISWIIGYAISCLGFLLTQKYYPGNFAQLEIVWYFCSINVVMMTAPIFIIFQKIKFKPRRLITLLSQLSFGVYLCHFILVLISYNILYPILDIPAMLKLPAISFVAFTLASLVSYLLSKLKLSRYIGM